MKTFRTLDGRRAAKRAPTADERREQRIYWAGVHAVALAGFLACVIAGGFI